GDPHHYRIELMAKQVRELFGFVPDNLDDYVMASQISQAEAFKFHIEYFRARKWRTTGIIWWNLMDGWPQFSDAVVDYYFDKKLAYHYIKVSQQHVCIIVKEAVDANGVLAGIPGKDGVPLAEAEGSAVKTFNDIIVSNDTREAWQLEYEISEAQSGRIVLKGEGCAAPDCNTCLGRVSLGGGPAGPNFAEPAFYVIKWKAFGKGMAGRSSGDTAVLKSSTGEADSAKAVISTVQDAAVINGINHYITGIPSIIEKSEDELRKVFGQYKAWLTGYMEEVRRILP
ncbi:MAG: hypothetical protein PHG48_07145, partial [Eubacteriales bacterium]|nr:hypothetical protein [Eubacteriales bacterium]